MALKKPADFFHKKEVSTVEENFNQLIVQPQLRSFSDAFETYKNNINKFELLSDAIEDIQEELKSIRVFKFAKEELDEAMMACSFLLEGRIKEIKDNIDKVSNQFKISSSIKYKELEENISKSNKDVISIVGEKVDVIEDSQELFNKKLNKLKIDIVENETHLNEQNKLIDEFKNELNEKVKVNFVKFKKADDGLSKKIEYIEEMFAKFNEQTILSEGLLDEPPSIDNEDPLTPLGKGYVTTQQLQDHYRTFINRIQQQLSTLGGGGETRLKYLDDVVGIATNASAYDGKFLKYNHSLTKFEFANVDITSDSWVEGADGPWTNGSVGIGTSVIESGNFPGNKLIVDGNARITGIVSIGTASITFNPDSGSISSGDVQVVASGGGAKYTGILTAIDFDSTSDIKLKKNIKQIEDPIKKVMKIEGVSFNWKKDNRPSLGVVADQLQEVIPELVNGSDPKTVNYNGLVGLLIECVKNQQKQIDELKEQLNN